MTTTSKTVRFDSVVAEAAPAAKAPTVAAQEAAAKLELLDGDEIIQFSIKPAPWFIFLVSFRVLITLVAIAVAFSIAMQMGATPAAAVPFQVLAGLAALRVGIATLQWASRLYVLTNRRAMRFKGVFNVDVAECRLSKITAVELTHTWYSRALRIGSIQMRSVDPKHAPILWEDVPRPNEVHELLVRAIRKSQSGR